MSVDTDDHWAAWAEAERAADSMTTVTLVAPFLDAIERQLDRDIAILLKHEAEHARWVSERMDWPLLELIEEHHRCWNPGKGDPRPAA